MARPSVHASAAAARVSSTVAAVADIDSWVLNYLTRDEQHEVAAVLDGLGRELDLSWVDAESPGLCPGIPLPARLRDEHITVLMVTRWRNGKRTEHHLGLIRTAPGGTRPTTGTDIPFDRSDAGPTVYATLADMDSPRDRTISSEAATECRATRYAKRVIFP